MCSSDLTACEAVRGTGCGGKRDGIVAGNIWAAYTHLHAAATPQWAEALVRAAKTAVVPA